MSKNKIKKKVDNKIHFYLNDKTHFFKDSLWTFPILIRSSYLYFCRIFIENPTVFFFYKFLISNLNIIEIRIHPERKKILLFFKEKSLNLRSSIYTQSQGAINNSFLFICIWTLVHVFVMLNFQAQMCFLQCWSLSLFFDNIF